MSFFAKYVALKFKQIFGHLDSFKWRSSQLEGCKSIQELKITCYGVILYPIICEKSYEFPRLMLHSIYLYSVLFTLKDLGRYWASSHSWNYSIFNLYQLSNAPSHEQPK